MSLKTISKIFSCQQYLCTLSCVYVRMIYMTFQIPIFCLYLQVNRRIHTLQTPIDKNMTWMFTVTRSKKSSQASNIWETFPASINREWWWKQSRSARHWYCTDMRCTTSVAPNINDHKSMPNEVKHCHNALFSWTPGHMVSHPPSVSHWQGQMRMRHRIHVQTRLSISGNGQSPKKFCGDNTTLLSQMF